MHLPQLCDDIKHLRWTLMQVVFCPPYSYAYAYAYSYPHYSPTQPPSSRVGT